MAAEKESALNLAQLLVVQYDYTVRIGQGCQDVRNLILVGSNSCAPQHHTQTNEK
jgi:hypothetical protein